MGLDLHVAIVLFAVIFLGLCHARLHNHSRIIRKYVKHDSMDSIQKVDKQGRIHIFPPPLHKKLVHSVPYRKHVLRHRNTAKKRENVHFNQYLSDSEIESNPTEIQNEENDDETNEYHDNESSRTINIVPNLHGIRIGNMRGIRLDSHLRSIHAPPNVRGVHISSNTHDVTIPGNTIEVEGHELEFDGHNLHEVDGNGLDEITHASHANFDDGGNDVEHVEHVEHNINHIIHSPPELRPHRRIAHYYDAPTHVDKYTPPQHLNIHVHEYEQVGKHTGNIEN